MSTPSYSVLFVCTANRCRSPMAEALLRLQVAAAGETGDWLIASAGTWAVDGQPAMPNTVAVMREWGVDLSHHRSRSLTPSLLQAFRLILAMTAGHQEALLTEFPECAPRLMLMSELIGRRFDILDPVTGPIEDYRNTARELDKILRQGMPLLRRRARE
ncbi:MAG: protein-tyrosine-phosphatase [Litorilinea sp.]|nr:MAG: protein-tyrosine-phosphatase [Litorilinea sp.]